MVIMLYKCIWNGNLSLNATYQDIELTTLGINKACSKRYVFVDIENTIFETKWYGRQTLET